LWIYWDDRKGWTVYDVDKRSLVQIDAGPGRSLLFVKVFPGPRVLALAISSNAVLRYVFFSERILDAYLDEITHYYYENDYVNMARAVEKMLSDFYYKILKV